MPGNNLLRPPEIIQEDAFGVFSTNPSKRTTGRIAKGIVNNTQRVESFPAIGGPDNHDISVFSSSLVNKFFHSVREWPGILIPFCRKTCLAQVSHILLHLGTHSVPWPSLKMSIRLFLERDRQSYAVLNSHAVFKNLRYHFGPPIYHELCDINFAFHLLFICQSKYFSPCLYSLLNNNLWQLKWSEMFLFLFVFGFRSAVDFAVGS